MKPVDYSGGKFSPVMVCALVLGLIGFVACGGSDSQQANDIPAAETQSAGETAAAEKAPSDSAAGQPAGWQSVRIGEWTISFPESWNGDPDTDIWEPGEVGPFMGRPDVSFVSGGIPVMPPATFDDRVKTRMGGEALESTKVTVAGFSGVKCTWEQMGKKHRGIFLEEKVGAGMVVVNFFDCQAPVDEFDQYKADFEKILDSVRK